MKARLIPKPPSDGSFELSARAFWTSGLVNQSGISANRLGESLRTYVIVGCKLDGSRRGAYNLFI
jgi:hypothetical protein